MKHLILALSFLLGILGVSAQSYTVQGTVKDFHIKSPLKGVSIKLGNLKTTTDASGYFKLTSVKGGQYDLTATHPDCNDFKEVVNITEDKNINILLEHHENEIETVVLHGNVKSRGSLVIQSLSKEEISKNSTENLGNLLSKISGLGTLKTGNSIAKPIIHGLYGSRVAILTNGVKLAEQEWGIEHAPNVDVNNFARIDVIKGASALKYGADAVGGVVVLEPAILPKKDSLSGLVRLSGISNGRGFATDVNIFKTWENGWAVRTNGGYKKLGDLEAPDYGLQNTGLESQSFSFGVQNINFMRGVSFDYYLTNQNIGILRSSHVSSSDDLANALQQSEPLYQRDFSYDIDNPRQDVEHHIAKVSAFKRFENLGKVSATYSFQYNHREEYDIRRGEELSEIPSLDLELITHDFSLSNLIERDHFSLETGFNAQYQNNYSNTATQTRRLVPNYDKYSGGAFSVFNYKLSPSLNVEAALRYDYAFYDIIKYYNLSDWQNLYAAAFPEFEVRVNQNRIFTNPKLTFQNFSYNAGVEYHPSGNFNLKFNYSRMGRTPNIAELAADGLHHSAAIIEKGNLAIKNEDGHQFNLAVRTNAKFLDGFELSVNPYYFITNNFVNQVPTGYQNTQFGNFIIYDYQQIDAKMYGVDVDLKVSINSNLTYFGNGSYVYGQDQSNDVPLILMVPPNFKNAVEYKSKKNNNFFINVNHNTFLQQKRFPQYNIAIQLFDSQGNAFDQPVDISTPPKSYTLWNLKTGININKQLSTVLTVDNIFNKSYRDYLNRLRYFSDEMGRNFILTLNYQF